MQRKVVQVSESLSQGTIARAARGGVAALSGSAVRFGVQLFGMILIARLLGPAAYGAAALVILASALAEVLRTSGISTVIIQRRVLGLTRARLLVVGAWVQGLTAGGIAAIIVVLFSGTFPTPPFGPLLVAVTFIAQSSAAVPLALLNRQLQISTITALEVVATLIGTGSAVAIALAGGGSLALYVQPAVMGVALAIGANCFAPVRPMFSRRFRGTLADLGFAASILSTQLLNTSARNADKALVGFAFGPAAAGLFTQASQLLTIPLDQVGGALQRVALPLMSRAAHQRELLRQGYRRIVLIATMLLWPTLAVLAVLAEPTIEWLFGSAWQGSAAIFQCLLLAGFAQSVGYVTVWLFVATSRVHVQTAWTLISRPVVLASFLVGIPWGPGGMAVAFSVCSCIVAIPAFLLAAKGSGLRLRDFWAPLGWPAVVAGLAALGAAAASTVVSPAQPAAWGEVLIGLAGAAAGVGAACILPPIRRLVRGVSDAFRTAPSPTTVSLTSTSEAS